MQNVYENSQAPFAVISINALPTTLSTALLHFTMNFTTGATALEILSLDNIRNQLIRLEDTIIFCALSCCCSTSSLTTALIERAQFAHNPKIYKAGAFKAETHYDGSWLEWFLLETESFHGELNAHILLTTSPVQTIYLA